MRVLLVAPSPPPYGGMALQAQQMLRLLRHDGVDVAFFASNFALPGLLGGVGRIPGARTALRACLMPFKLLRQARRVDVIHVMAASWWYFFLCVVPAVIVGRACRKRIVLNYRGGEAGPFFDRYGWLIAPFFRLATVVTAPSEFLAALIRARFRVPVLIVSNIVDLGLFKYRARTPIQPRLLVTRHLEKIYDIEGILRAFQVVQQRRPGACLWIAGGGSEERHLKAMTSALNLANVRFLGEVAHRELPEIYSSCDIYVNASRVDNFPGALIEAAASGLVVVSTAAGGIPFIFEDGRTARLVAPGDWQALATALDAVLDAPSSAITAMTSAAAATARACDWAQVRKSLFVAYGFPVNEASIAKTGLDGVRCIAG